MSKTLVSMLIAGSLLTAGTASAQSYYQVTSSGSCANLTSNLSYGSRGTQVSLLQSFLVAQNYPGGGSWMITGYFGQATVQAVRNFQQSVGLPTTGAVDAQTRAAIAGSSCSGFPGLGGTGYTYPQPYNYNYYTPTTPYGYNYPYNYNGYNNTYNVCGSYPNPFANCNITNKPTLTSLSSTSAAPGQQLTIYGTGFGSYNTVYVGGTTLSSIASNSYNALTITVPSLPAGQVSVSVGNSNGTSNALTLTIAGYNNGYPYQNPNYPYGPGYCPNNSPTISYLTPTSGSIGTQVTVYGSCFSSTGNVVHFGNGIISNLSSFDGLSVSFTVPTSLSGFGYQPIGLGTYNITVTNGYGATSNAMPFTITSLGASGTPTITSVNGPTSLQAGTSGTWTITVNNPSGTYLTTSVRWGDEGTYGGNTQPLMSSVQNQTTLTFTHTYYTSGTYTATFTVSNPNSQQTTGSATVTVYGGTSGTAPTISYLSPSSGRIGTQLQITGSGFNATDNTLHFGNGGSMHVPSLNGTTIYFTVPSYLSPCDVAIPGSACATYAQQVTPGSYPIFIASGGINSNTVSFQVTQ